MKTVIISANTIAERDIIIRNIYSQLTNDLDNRFIVNKDRVNRIQIFHNEGNLPEHLRSILRTYIVVVLPINLNLSPLEGITGKVEFHLDSTIDVLTKHLNRLKTLQRAVIIKENKSAETFEHLIRSLA